MEIISNIASVMFVIMSTALTTCLVFATIEIIVKMHRETKANKAFEKMINKLADEFVKMEVQKVESGDETPKADEEPSMDYASMTIGELKKLAKEAGIKGYYNLHKDELIKALNN